ncbi:synaptonemal complex protein 1 isoform X2 [Nelusetta ayraudi]|uniref:synaptonemal complex protein 1 isoform X2 n=1 Tax=Nelusetta ayraudi TaxID=303726 RepID=UPI003F72FFD3
MDRDRGFNFKLLVPPRVNSSQVSAVRPQENIENCGDVVNTLQPGTYSKYFDKEQNMPLSNTSMVASTLPTKQAFAKTKAVSPVKDKTNCNPKHVFVKLFDEVEKIHSWKVQIASDTVQMDRRLQENKKTIETQRKAIQELQFGNESLSMKLEEQISDNENLRNKDNATRNLCNILKDTFERSAEKIHLFESEREETHHVLMENSESIQKLVEAFEELRLTAEADQQEIHKVKEEFLQLENLKEKYCQKFTMAEKKVDVLEREQKEKENYIQKLLLDLSQTQKEFKQLQETAKEKSELLAVSKAEQESLLQELNTTKQNHKEAQESFEATVALLEKSKEEYVKMIESNDLCLEELSRVKALQAEKLEAFQATTQELQSSLALELQRAKELEDELASNKKELQRKNTLLQEALEQSAQKDEQMKNLRDDLDQKCQSVESMKVEIDVAEARLAELTAELLKITEEAQFVKNEAETALAENNALKTACQAAEKAKEESREKSTMAEIKVQELEGQLCSEKQKNSEHTRQMEELRRHVAQYEEKYKELLSNFNELQSETASLQQLVESGSLNAKTIEADFKDSEEKAFKLTREIQKLENENRRLRNEVGSITTAVQEKSLKIENLEKDMEENVITIKPFMEKKIVLHKYPLLKESIVAFQFERLENEIRGKEKQIATADTKLCFLKKKFDMKIRVQAEYQKENKVLKKQLMKQTSKSSHLEIEIDSVQEELQNLRRLNEENHVKLSKDLDSKSQVVAELSEEVERLRWAEAEAVKNKDEMELKCQHKIADMVALMEKHKNQYDRIVEGKDAQLSENKKSAAHLQSVVRDLDKHNSDSDKLKQQLKKEVAEKENLRKELTDLKKDMSSMKAKSDINRKQLATPSYVPSRPSETPGSSKMHLFELSKTKRTPSLRKGGGATKTGKTPECDACPKTVQSRHGITQNSKGYPNTPKSSERGPSGTVKIRSYRIKTPPSDVGARWNKTAIELDSKSDSSDLSDIMNFAGARTPHPSVSHCQLNLSQKSKTPIGQKSPRNSLKLTAMKRMRDAGWAAVIGQDKKKKRVNDKIFA